MDSKKFKIKKEKCIGCGLCVQSSEGGTKLGEDMKAVVIDHKKLEQFGGTSICPFGAIEEIEEEKEK